MLNFSTAKTLPIDYTGLGSSFLNGLRFAFDIEMIRNRGFLILASLLLGVVAILIFRFTFGRFK